MSQQFLDPKADFEAAQAQLATTTKQLAALSRKTKANTSDLPNWDDEVDDVRDFIDSFTLSLENNDHEADRHLGLLLAHVPSRWRSWLQKIFMVTHTAKHNRKPTYSEACQALITAALPYDEYLVAGAALEDANLAQRYDESFISWRVRLNEAFLRADAARLAHDDRCVHDVHKLGPLTIQDKFKCIGRSALPQLKCKFARSRAKCKSSEAMFDVLQKEMTEIRTAGSLGSATVDPHMAPLVAMSSSSLRPVLMSTLTGKPSQQLIRSRTETFKHWNTGSGSYFPGITPVGPSESSPSLESKLHSSLESLCKRLEDLEKRPQVVPPPAPTVTENETLSRLVSDLGRLEKRLEKGNPAPTSMEVDVSHLHRMQSNSNPQPSLAQSPSPTTRGGNIPPTHHSNILIPPFKPNEVHWSLGFDPGHLAVARAAADGEAFGYFCLWCRTDAHSSAACPFHCARCSSDHALSACPVNPMDITCSWGHRGHVDKSCVLQITGLGRKRIEGRPVKRLAPSVAKEVPKLEPAKPIAKTDDSFSKVKALLQSTADAHRVSQAAQLKAVRALNSKTTSAMRANTAQNSQELRAIKNRLSAQIRREMSSASRTRDRDRDRSRTRGGSGRSRHSYDKKRRLN